MTLVGKSIPRKEGRKKVTGQALYVDDLKFDGMLHGVTVRSSIARGRIKSISFKGDMPWTFDANRKPNPDKGTCISYFYAESYPD